MATSDEPGAEAAAALADGELVQRLRLGHAGAFDEVYRAHHARLHAFAVRLLGRRDGVEDVLQETWLRLARNAGRLRPDTNLRAWLFTVTRNLVVGRHRWALMHTSRMLGLARVPPPDPPTPLDLTQASETERRLEAALAALPLKYREVLLLVAVEGLSPLKAAAILDLKPEATRQRLARARAMMQTLLEDER